MKFIAKNIQDTKKIAENLSNAASCGDVITLSGDLGAGKTTFSQFFINYLLDEKTDVTSPTFNIVHPYYAEDYTIYHFDLYRIKDENELENIGFFDAVEDGICLIEWPDIAKKFLPKNTIEVTISTQKEGVREFCINNAPEKYKEKLTG